MGQGPAKKIRRAALISEAGLVRPIISLIFSTSPKNLLHPAQ
jgi:hypothetical protein